MISQALVSWFISIYILYQICLASPSFNDISSSGILVHLYIYPIPDISASPSFNDTSSSGILVHLYIYPIPDMSASRSFNDTSSMIPQALVSWFISIYILYQICLASPSFNDTSSSGILVGYGMYTREESCLTTGEGPLKLHYCDQVTSFHL